MAQRIHVMFDAHAHDGKVWCVRSGNSWHRVKAAYLTGPARTVYSGPRARQPRAYLAGVGRVRVAQDVAYVSLQASRA